MSTVEKNVQNLIRLIKDINDHPDRDTALAVEYIDGGISSRYLTNNDDVVPSDLGRLIDELKVRMDSTLITRHGSNSEEYYLLAKQPGIRVSVLERDSFGPLVVGVKYIEGDWWVTYG